MKAKLEAEHFRHLSVLLNSGIDAHKAMTLLGIQASGIAPLIQPVINNLRRGSTLARSLEKTHLLMKHEIEILKVAEHAGQLPAALNFIATQYEKRLSRISKLRSKLWLPFAVLAIGVIAGILLDLSQDRGVFDSIFSGLILFTVVIFVSQYGLSLLKTDTFRYLSVGWHLGLQHHSYLYQRYFEYHWYTLLMWQVEAGVDFQNAFNKVKGLITNTNYQVSIQNAQHLVQQGQSVVLALTQNELVFTQELKQALQVGEQSGSWAEAVNHHLKIQRSELELTTESIFEWIPRIYYILIICLVLPRVF